MLKSASLLAARSVDGPDARCEMVYVCKYGMENGTLVALRILYSRDAIRTRFSIGKIPCLLRLFVSGVQRKNSQISAQALHIIEKNSIAQI